jgi:hypothetical protein
MSRSSEVLFTINIWGYEYKKGKTCEIVEIYGPTKEKLETSRPVNSTLSGRLGYHVMEERRERIKHLDSYKVKNKYYQSGRMEEWEQEKKKVIMETNWKLRVLNEQEREKKKIQEAAEALLELSKAALKKERSEKAKRTREQNKAKQNNQPPRRSVRIKKQNA